MSKALEINKVLIAVYEIEGAGNNHAILFLKIRKKLFRHTEGETEEIVKILIETIEGRRFTHLTYLNV